MVLNRKLLHFMGLYPVETIMKQKNEFLSSKKRILIVFSLYFILLYRGFTNIYYNLSDLNTSTNAILVVMGATCGSGCYFGIRSNSKYIQVLFNSLQEIVDNGT